MKLSVGSLRKIIRETIEEENELNEKFFGGIKDKVGNFFNKKSKEEKPSSNKSAVNNKKPKNLKALIAEAEKLEKEANELEKKLEILKNNEKALRQQESKIDQLIDNMGDNSEISLEDLDKKILLLSKRNDIIETITQIIQEMTNLQKRRSQIYTKLSENYAEQTKQF